MVKKASRSLPMTTSISSACDGEQRRGRRSVKDIDYFLTRKCGVPREVCQGVCFTLIKRCVIIISTAGQLNGMSNLK